MLPSTITLLAETLAARLAAGRLREVGPVDVGNGDRLDAELVASLVLADVDAMLTTEDVDVQAHRWQSVQRQLEVLVQLTSER